MSRRLSKPELTVVVPTFQERQNIRPLYALLRAALKGIAWEVVFVDDDSPDGTAQEAQDLAAVQANVRVRRRIGRRGLAGACAEGILTSAAPLVAVIDADGQHDEGLLPRMVAAFRADPTLDLAVGVRQPAGPRRRHGLCGASGGAGQSGAKSGEGIGQGARAGAGATAGAHGLSALRARGSAAANVLARRLLGLRVSDPMSGFFMIRRAAFAEVVMDLQPQGFKILADMLSAARGRWRVRELPYDFRPRRHGASKLGLAVTLEFLGLLLARLSGGLLPVRLLLFLMVGATGLFVQLAAVRVGLSLAEGSFLVSQAAGVFLAMTTNFVLNNRLTYRDRALRGVAFARGLCTFWGVCGLGALANLGVAGSVFDLLPYWALASISGTGAGAMLNFWASTLVTWRPR